jgi:hypothetical protein
VDVAPHDVFYDEERRLWYCDIEINPHRAYYPFVRLALARYQPVSVNAAHLSNIVLADFMSLAPDRWLNVIYGADSKYHLIVYGNSYSDSSSHVEAKNAPSMSLIDRLTNTARTLKPADISSTSVVYVWVERLEEREGEDFGWKKVSEAIVQSKKASDLKTRAVVDPREMALSERARAVELFRKRRFDSLVREKLVDFISLFAPLWEGDVAIPSQPAGARLRIVIAEYEEYLVDDKRPYDKVPEKKERRLVFVEHIEL